MTGPSSVRDGSQVDALVTDRYLDSLLAAHARGADHGPAASYVPLRSIADRLALELPRYHPSFRFEEALADRLRDVGLAMRRRSDDERQVVPYPNTWPATDGWDPIVRPGRTTLERPWIIGGALTSAALSLAGAAFVAWRRGRPTGSSRLI